MLSISEVALDILRLSSIISNSPFEYDVIQLNVVRAHDELVILCSRTRSPRLWDVIRGNSCIKSPGCIHLIAFVDLVPIATEKVSSIWSNTICCIWNQWKSTLKERSSFCTGTLQVIVIIFSTKFEKLM